MSLLVLILVVILVLSLIGSLPIYGYSRDFGPWPSASFGTILIIVLIFWLLSRV
jgi:hypothetical protein